MEKQQGDVLKKTLLEQELLEKALKAGRFYSTEAQLACARVRDWAQQKEHSLDEILPVSYDIDRERLEAFLHFLYTMSHFFEEWATIALSFVTSETLPKGSSNKALEALEDANELIGTLVTPEPEEEQTTGFEILLANFKKDLREVLEKSESHDQLMDAYEVEAELDQSMGRLQETFGSSVVLKFLAEENQPVKNWNPDDKKLELLKKRKHVLNTQMNLYFSEGIMFEAAAKLENKIAEQFSASYRDPVIGELLDNVIQRRKHLSKKEITEMKASLRKRMEELNQNFSEDDKKEVEKYFDQITEQRNDSLETRKKLEAMKK